MPYVVNIGICCVSCPVLKGYGTSAIAFFIIAGWIATIVPFVGAIIGGLGVSLMVAIGMLGLIGGVIGGLIGGKETKFCSNCGAEIGREAEILPKMWSESQSTNSRGRKTCNVDYLSSRYYIFILSLPSYNYRERI